MPADELAARARATSIELVLTAHPTETTRRSVLLAHIRIQEQLVVLDDPRVSPAERTQAEERIAEEVTLLWQTDEVRHDRLRISDEIRHALWFFEHSLLDAATELLARLARARFPERRRRSRSGRGSAATWTATRAPGLPRSTRRSTAPATLALGRYRDEVRALAVEIAAARSLVTVAARARRVARARRARAAAYAAEIGARNTLEPYRRKLSFMWWRLGNDGYATAEELLDDLAVISRSLEANGGRRVAEGRVARLQRQVEMFGFHVAKLDVRLHARELGEPPRAQEAVAAAEAARGRHGPAALDTVIVSGTGSADDVVRALDLTSEPLAVVPLFETVDDLDRAPAIVGELFADERYAARMPGARRTRRGDGRLLRLGQGQRLPRGAVGDLPRAGGARRRRARARRRADDLPRPRRQRRARRRADPRRDPRAAGRLPAGPASR